MPKPSTYGPKTGGAVRHEAYTQAYANKIVEMLEAGTAPWQKPWNPGEGHGGMPYNATSGKAYSGANAMALFMEQELRGYTDERWLTFKQAQALGAHVRRGERGTPLVKWVETQRKADTDNAQGDDEEKPAARLVPVLFTVFNAEQVEGLPAPPVREMPTELQRHETCEQLMKDAGVLIAHDGGNRAFYRPMTDSIHLPTVEQFHSMDAYYAVALHELGHATGHPTRLGRDLTGKFGSESYAREELRAEIASWMAGERLGIGHDPGQHGAYVGHWVKLLREDPKEILRACADAEKICQHLGVEKYERAPMLKAEQSREQSNVVELPAARQPEEWSPGALERQREERRQAARVADAHTPCVRRDRGYSMGL